MFVSCLWLVRIHNSLEIFYTIIGSFPEFYTSGKITSLFYYTMLLPNLIKEDLRYLSTVSTFFTKTNRFILSQYMTNKSGKTSAALNLPIKPGYHPAPSVRNSGAVLSLSWPSVLAI